MAAEFVHLHLHTDFSMLDGACRIEGVAELCREYGMPAAAITDHGNMCGAVDFYRVMGANGIKPIIGCEFYVAPGSRHEKDPSHPHHKGYHLVLLAADFEGYQNLCELNRIAHHEGQYYKPRIDKEVLASHHRGLIGASACLSGEVASNILEDRVGAAQQALDDYVQILGKGNFYVELQDHDIPDQRKANTVLRNLADEWGAPLLATNDAHYLKREHADSQDILICIGTQTTVQTEKRMKMHGNEFYFKTAEEMQARFGDCPEALRNSLEIAERCNVHLNLDAPNNYPVYDPPDGSDRADYLRGLCLAAVAERYGFDPATLAPAAIEGWQRKILARLDHELNIIGRMDFVSYFLVVWDFLDYARRQGIPVGPGRGSGAGSIVAYLLHITDIDPLHYNLLFERFLNPERVSPPDFDIDLCERRRGEVIEYVRDKYGSERVAQIGTFGTLKAKAVLKDVARATEHSFEEGNYLAKLVPDDAKDLADALKKNPEFAEAVAEKDAQGEPGWVAQVVEKALPIEGLNRNMSIHAAGVIIGNAPLTELVPIGRGAGGEVITQFSAKPCEELGLLKMDFLGLRTLTIIQDTCEHIRHSQGIDLDPARIPFDDEATYALLRAGHTACVFQLESGGMQRLCRRFGVHRIEDIIALIALYRPGPMEFLEEFIDRKHGLKRIDYDVPEMEEILAETHGIMLYQEQVMQVVQTVAGFSLGQADILRRAMGKKKEKVMRDMYDLYLEGAKKNGHSEEKAEAIWNKVLMFAGYGFNKSHSAAYGFLAYRTAWLKAHYPVEFMAANLTNEMKSAERVSELIRECRDMQIPVLPPDVNSSHLQFTVDGGSIRFGLAAIKGVGSAAAEAILAARAEGAFTSMQDFCERVGSAANRRLLEALVKCGAFDWLGLRRSQMFAICEDVIVRALHAAHDRAVGQCDFFDLLGGGDDGEDSVEAGAPAIPEWEDREKLGYEKELLGFYVTGHPLAAYEDLVATYALHSILDLRQQPPDAGVRLGAIISAKQQKISNRDQKPWALLVIEDRDASAECPVYPDVYEQCRDHLQEEAAVFIEGHIRLRDGEDQPQLVVSKVVPMADAAEHFTREVVLSLPEERLNRELVGRLQQTLQAHHGETGVVFALRCRDGRLAFVEVGERYRLRYDDAARRALEALLGEGCCRAKPLTEPPKRAPRKKWQKGQRLQTRQD